MKVSSDHYFHIGHEHIVSGRPCQDHALSSTFKQMACAVVSDGCSDGKETDMGARLITFSTISSIEKSLNCRNDQTLFSLSIETYAKAMRQNSADTLGLSARDLLATSVKAIVTEDFAYAHLEGDGVIAWKETSGKVVMIRYDWANNTPCYPSYGRDDFRSFIDIQSTYEEQGLTEVIFEWTETDGFVLVRESHFEISQAVSGIEHRWNKEEIHNLSFLSVMSDGVTRVDDVDWKDVVLEMLAFKSVSGEFVKRRLIRMNKEWSKKGIKPLDDIAVATIHIEHEEGENHDSLK